MRGTIRHARNRLGVLVALVLCLPFVPAHASEQGLVVMLGTANDTLVSETGTHGARTYELGIGYRLPTLWVFEARTARSSGGRDGDNNSIRSRSYGFHLVGEFREHARLRPYLSLGLGLLESEFPCTSGLSCASRRDEMQSVGAGLRYRFSSRWSVRLNVEQRRVLEARPGSDGNLYARVAGLSLMYRFSGAQ